jgi:hypothetical protein
MGELITQPSRVPDRALMMLTFSPMWVKPILERRKDVTFRTWPEARVKVGGSYPAATMGYPPKKFATVEVPASGR